MKITKIKKTICASIIVAITMSNAGFVLADEIEPSEGDVAEYTETLEEDVSEEPESSEEDTEYIEETSDEESSADVEATDLTEETESEEATEPVESEDLSEIVTADEPITVSECIPIDVDYDNDLMAEQFITEAMDLAYTPAYKTYNYDSMFNSYELVLFNNLRYNLNQIANGYISSSEIMIPESELVFYYTAADLGLANLNNSSAVEKAVGEILPVDSRNIMNGVLVACPSDLYWFDKTEGMWYWYSVDIRGNYAVVSDFWFGFTVSQEYRDYNSADPEYNVDVSFGSSLRAASSNAKSIIKEYAGLNDYEKLKAYCDEICDLVEYNNYAVENDIPYGNPWQLVWVFDGDPSTDVVCEGYSKAFQYLCDNTKFAADDIYAISVSGDLYFPGGSGPHMWNVVHMNNGKNYLVDVTNCDGAGYDLFMAPYSYGSAANGYGVSDCQYYYDDDTLGSFSIDSLTLSSTAYDPSTAAGWTLKNGKYYYIDSNGKTLYNSWIKEGNKTYYVGSDGARVTGRLKLDGDFYYFKSDGRMVTGWKDLGNYTYYFDPSTGKAVTGWQTIDGGKYYFKTNWKLETGWKVTSSGTAYYLDPAAGGKAATGLTEIEGKTYYFASNGRMQKGIVNVGQYVYYFDDNGVMQTGRQKIDGDFYYFKTNGRAVAGFKTLGNYTYYFDPATGKALTGWQTIDGYKYYFKTNGKMETGWKVTSGGATYYFDPATGRAVTGWKTIDGVEYYFNSNGKLVT